MVHRLVGWSKRETTWHTVAWLLEFTCTGLGIPKEPMSHQPSGRQSTCTRNLPSARRGNNRNSKRAERNPEAPSAVRCPKFEAASPGSGHVVRSPMTFAILRWRVPERYAGTSLKPCEGRGRGVHVLENFLPHNRPLRRLALPRSFAIQS